MFISSLSYCNLRNLINTKISFSQQFNIISGPNASGKTSFLEAVYLLSGGRSFRTHLVRNIVKHGENCTSVHAKITKNDQEIQIGVQRCLKGKSERKLNSHLVSAASELASILPIQIIGYDRFSLLSGGPRYKREFLDWGLFHTATSFFLEWKRFNQCLKQRNASLRQYITEKEVILWNKPLIESGLVLEDYRKTYLNQLIPLIKENFSSFSMGVELDISYYSGWDSACSFDVALRESFSRDRQIGYTTQGPHRADVHWMVNKRAVHEVLSRGQQKALLFAIALAQNSILLQCSGKKCIVLIDDIAAELDSRNQKWILQKLSDLCAQIFITTINVGSIDWWGSGQGSRIFLDQGRVEMG